MRRARARRTSPRTARGTRAAPNSARAPTSDGARAATPRPWTERLPRRRLAEVLQPPAAVAQQGKPFAVVLLDGPTVADADDDRLRQRRSQRAVERVFLALVE